MSSMSRKKRPSSLPSIHDTSRGSSHLTSSNNKLTHEREAPQMLPYLVNIHNELFGIKPVPTLRSKNISSKRGVGEPFVSNVTSPELNGEEKQFKKQRPSSGPKHILKHSQSFNNMINGTVSQSEKKHAVIVIQRIVRGYIAKVLIWRLPDGIGCLRMIIRIQCWMRQCNARSLLSKRLIARDRIAACLIQGLFRGFKYGRLAAKRR